MTAIAYNSTRSLLSGHAVNDAQAIDIDMVSIDRERKRNATRHQSLSGLPETWLKNIDERWYFTTDFLDMTGTDLQSVREFLDSCAAGEQFTIDPYGSVAAPDSPIICELDSDSYREKRTGARWMQVSFSVRVL